MTLQLMLLVGGFSFFLGSVAGYCLLLYYLSREMGFLGLAFFPKSISFTVYLLLCMLEHEISASCIFFAKQ
jgi:hypothetical protein